MKLEKEDILIIGVLTIIFFSIGIWNLGALSSPETTWAPSCSGESFYIDLGDQREIRTIYFLETDASKKNYSIYSGIPGKWKSIAAYKHDGYFLYWNKVDVNTESRYLRFVSNASTGELSEVVLYGTEKNKKIGIIDIIDESNAQTAIINLVDEQEKVDDPPSHESGTYFDEIYFARTAYEYINHLEPFEWTHPPLGKLIIAFGMTVFGVTPLGWRIMSLLFGCAFIPLFYLFGKRIFGTKAAATFCAFLITFESMHFVLSRIAMVDIFLVFFLTLMFYFFFLYYEGEPFKRWKTALFLSGICFGLAFSVKWSAFYGALAVMFLFLLLEYEDYGRYKKMKALGKKKIRKVWGEKKLPDISSFWRDYVYHPILILLISFILIPFFIYILSYIPFMLVPGPGHGITEVFRYQFNMYSYHSTLTATHPYTSMWWSWPLMLKPVFLYLGSGLPEGWVSKIVLIGNPAIWWASIPCLCYVGWNAVKNRDNGAIFILAVFLIQWLPYVPITRVLFIYHMFPNVPFMIFGIVYCLRELWEKEYGKYITLVYLLAVVLCFVYFYPITSGYSISTQFAEQVEATASQVMSI
jgi:predicted membrane-bound dolichyl-phosphate-mannose-protein mannosyltransferase